MHRADRERYLANIQAEIDGAALYRALAEIEAGSELATAYARLADAAERHADIWRTGLREAGAAIMGITGRSALCSGLRQVIFGVKAAAITFGVGRLFGATLGG